jgi:uncharacterized protein YciI
MFIVILRYLVDVETIDVYKEDHVNFLCRYYDMGVFIASGVQTPRAGGVIIARCENREKLESILSEDPFFQNKCAEYQLFEFEATRHEKEFQAILEKTTLI